MLERLGDDPGGPTEPSIDQFEQQLAAAFGTDFTLVAHESEPRGVARRWLRIMATAVAVTAAVATTLAVTALWGPDVGGLTGVVTIMAATMFGYQLLRGCPGRR